jgi:D-sedoheptulose 7-phosphate isomerase
MRFNPARCHMQDWLKNYQRAQMATASALPLDQIAQLVNLLRDALQRGAGIYAFGNGGSAANASHFATDLGKGASDKVGKRFRILSLNDNVAWMMAISNDYCYEDVFVRQLENYGRPGDIAFGISVSGSSPNCVKAMQWAKEHGLRTVALVGAKRGPMAELADLALVINDTHYGRVEDAQMTICHMLCYAFMENPTLGQ